MTVSQENIVATTPVRAQASGGNKYRLQVTTYLENWAWGKERYGGISGIHTSFMSAQSVELDEE